MKTFKQFIKHITEDGVAGGGDVSTNQIGAAPDTGGVAKIDPLLNGKKKVTQRLDPKLV